MTVNEADGSNEKWKKIIDMKIYNRAEISDALERSGVTVIMTGHHDKKSFIAVLAEKRG